MLALYMTRNGGADFHGNFNLDVDDFTIPSPLQTPLQRFCHVISNRPSPPFQERIIFAPSGTYLPTFILLTTSQAQVRGNFEEKRRGALKKTVMNIAYSVLLCIRPSHTKLLSLKCKKLRYAKPK